jgi:pyruvate-ferredoxin/flavodoxin oxidoreductase
MDGNTAAAHAAYAFTEVAGIYPITPSSPMAECVDAWSVAGRKNIFDETVRVAEMQSEAGAAATTHGSLQAGSLTTTFTASQGLLLMIPNMYKIAGELLPGVFHVAARTLASHALSIFGDHQDVYACRGTGFAMLASGSVQEVMDLGGVAHLAAIESRVPFVHFFDGFRTSHEIQKVEVMDYEDYKKMVDWKAIQDFRDRALNPEHPVIRGTAQNPDVFFQARVASNPFYEEVPKTVVKYLDEISAVTGREYHPFNYYGDPNAENIIVAMGSVTDTIDQVIDYMRANEGKAVGVVKVHLYRPFVNEYLFDAIPSTVKRITVLDRTLEQGANDQPLALDVKSAFFMQENAPQIFAGIYGLSSKDTTPGQIKAVFDNMYVAEPKDHFTIGINDDVTHTNLIAENLVCEPEGTVSCKFWGLGSDGTVGANKNAIKIIGDHTDLYAQGYFDYDSKKSGGITVSNLRFGPNPINSPYLIVSPDFVSCSTESYVYKYDMLGNIRKGGKFLMNTVWTPEELEKVLPAKFKREIANNDIEFYTINATKIAAEIGLGRRTNMIMQAAFFKLADIIPIEKAVEYSKASIKKTYGLKGDKIVEMNYKAVDAGIDPTKLIKIDVPESWKTAEDAPVEEKEVPKFIKEVLEPVDAFNGNTVPVSAFTGIEDGTFPSGTAAYEKRGIAVNVPEWIPENCIQCNRCSFVCPHAAIRPVVMTEEEAAAAPEDFVTLKATGGKAFEGLKYRIQVDTLDCTGCGNCQAECPAKTKALEMKPIHTQEKQIPLWDVAMSAKPKKELMNKYTVKGSQFQKPLLEFSGACAGCGETPYIKTITQLYGDRMMVANATGCTSIWGASCPSMPYCTNDEGKGPSWANSLFEDAAEYGFGMLQGVTKMRNTLASYLEQIAEAAPKNVAKACTDWIKNKDDAEGSKKAAAALSEALADYEADSQELGRKLQFVKDNEDFFIKRSVWSFGGDGWAYDIGYGGLDQVLASKQDINVFCVDTEVYSNTGGQASKATPVAAVAQFAAGGERIKKKDLGMMAATYGYVYVAQVAMGADKNQYMKVLKEAEAYPGPSLIIGYAPCINHGIRGGMSKTQEHEAKAVECGYWHLWHYNPLLAEEGKNPFVLDSKKPDFDKFQDFIGTEVRYTSLKKVAPDVAQSLYDQTQKNAEARYEGYVKLAKEEA